ncbi:MAG: translocation/assembly module TamB domain-containing protein, partial [Bacteroidales bacterium]
IFDGSMKISDPNIQMEFLGKVDFSSEQPDFDFTANVSRLRPYYLNLNTTDPSYFASFLLKSKFSGIHPDSINGNINLVNSFFQRSGEQIQIFDFSMNAENSGDSSSLKIRSDVMDADVTGYYQFSTIAKSFKNLAIHYIPSLSIDEVTHNPDFEDKNNFEFSFEFKKVEKIVRFFTRDYVLSDSTYISGKYNPREYSTVLTAEIPRVGFRDNYWTDLYILAESDSIETEFNAVSSNLHLNNEMSLDNMTLTGSVFQDSLLSTLTWDSNQKPVYKGQFNISAGFAENLSSGNQKITIHTLPSYIIFNDTLWNVSPSVISVDSSSIKIDSFNISNQNQEFLVDGEVSKLSGTGLNLYFNELDLATLNVFTKRMKLQLAGNMTGQASLINAYENPLFLSDLKMNELFVNGQGFGDGELRAKWDNASRKIHILASGVKGEAEIFRVEGDYFPSSKDLSFDIDFDKIRLSAFEPFAEKLVSDIKGLGSGELNLEGTASQPLLTGEVNFFKASMIVNYLQTRYSFTDKLSIQNNRLLLDEFKLTDELGNNAIANGSVTSQYFKDFNLNINITTPDFLFLNTTESDNEVFYGKVIASGIVRVNGPPDNLYMDINASSGKNTLFYLPLYGAEEVNENDFIRFVNSSGKKTEDKSSESNYEVNLKGLSLNFNLEVTPDAEVQLIFDPKVGDILSGRGNGDLNITINSLGKFEIFGEMKIEEGDYLFTLQNLINKKLEVQPGGTITFNGDPTNANINLRAIYKLRTSVYTLAPEPMYGDRDLKKRIPVECHIIMSGRLLEPTINTDIVLPTADQQIKNIVNAAINSEEERLKQFISLLVINNFMSMDPGDSFLASSGSSSTASVAGVATSELLSNQLSHWLSQISRDFDIGLNYRPGDEITTDEVEVALSTQILDDRVTIQGNLGVGGQTTQTSSSTNTNNIVGDFDIDFKITENGKLHLKAFNRSNEDLLFQTSPYTQGVGVFYREDFNTFGELFRRYRDAILRVFSDKREEELSEAEETSMNSQ